AVLTVTEEDQVVGVEAADLPHQLGADRAAGARDHHALAAQVAEDAADVELHGLTAEEVVDVDLADAAQVDATGKHLVHAGDDLVGEVGPCLPDLVDDVTDVVSALRRHGDEHLVDLVLQDDLAGVLDGAKHRHAGDALALLVPIVVEEAHWTHARLGVT